MPLPNKRFESSTLKRNLFEDRDCILSGTESMERISYDINIRMNHN